MILPQIEIHAVDHCTLMCESCSVASPILPRRSYTLSEYSPWLDRLNDAGVTFERLLITGGESFLHPDLAGMLRDAKRYNAELSTITNLHWLQSEADLDAHADIFAALDELMVTYYQPYADRVGYQRLRALVAMIPRRWPNCRVSSIIDRIVTHFAPLRFTDQPGPIVRLECGFRYCLQLLSDGRLTRCPITQAIRARKVPPAMLSADRVTYDLAPPIDTAALAEWLAEFPFPLCHYCSEALDPAPAIPWRAVARTN